ncbi:2-dehydro-3-deoxy-6-phosphogalactonate aldolase [Neomicrococcus lactis]|uniref:2-dehydro-3-deoxyphosphogalactonate aldolase n=1 Tax=Neomicrococcus lactis TaxID=732241 RepID=A0A7W9DA75_9MICC|nr:2-dehydro-3-deoxy-6-phosphogalactonate aldolase [Neomicrococcus lactis]MBB5597335.1 2-dehydro-3-deoxyphosphogalactonate aldolase [Neomicrococcus lactis]
MSTSPTGLIAILRGITPEESEPIGEALYGAGFRSIEVPLNSPEPFDSIRRMRNFLPADCAVGAGTVLTLDDVVRSQQAGSDIIVSPNANTDVIRATVAAGMRSYPGVATATEAFSAIEAGATSLKIFPSDVVGVAGMKAWLAVIPANVEILPVGGIDSANLGTWASAGASGAGIGSTLYKPGRSVKDVTERAKELIAAWQVATS